MTLSIFNTEIFRHFGRMFSRILSKERWIGWMGILSKERWMGILPNLDLSLSGGVMFVDRGTRRDAGRNPHTPPDILELLSQDEESMVRWWVALNPSTPYGTWVRHASFGMVRVF